MVPSIYNVHTKGVRLRWTPVDGGGTEGVSATWTSTHKLYSPLTNSGLLLIQRSWRFF